MTSHDGARTALRGKVHKPVFLRRELWTDDATFTGNGLREPSGRTPAQAVCGPLPTTVARVRSKVRSCGICGGQSGTGTRFL
jgi:hypothetical protein